MVVTDDEYIIVEGIKAIISRLKLQCEVVGFVYNGTEALDVIRDKRSDIVITDTRMPGSDGLSLTEGCKESLLEVYYVVISGYMEFEYARRAITLGAMDYTDKPVTMQKIVGVLEEVEKKSNPPQYAYNRVMKETDKVVDLAMMGKVDDLEEAMEHLFLILRKNVLEFRQYRQEMYKIMSMLVQIFRGSNSDVLCQITRHNTEKWRDPEECGGFRMNIIRKMSEYLQGKEVGSNYRIIQELLQFVDEKYAGNIGLSELVMPANMNPAYLSILFRNEVGVTYVKYLTDLRIRKTKELPDEGMKVTKVSEKVGYYNYRYFCKIFKKHQGITSSEYKGHVRKRG